MTTSSLTATADARRPMWSARSASRRVRRERLIVGALFGAAAVSVLTTAGIIGVLLFETLAFFQVVSIAEFLLGTTWAPLFTPQHFGVLPLVGGTLLVAVIAMLVAVPLGVVIAIYLSEYAPAGFRRVVKPLLEILAGIPTVVYGYFALTFITPNLLRPLFGEAVNVFNAASAGIVVGIMILPMVASMSEDAMGAVPRSLREAAFALGATKLEVGLRVVFPAALSGIVASFILAISRAVGETMAVALAAGATPNLTANPLESIQTMTGYIVQVSLGDTPQGSLAFRTIFAVGMTLFTMTLLLNVLSQAIVRRFREVYQ
ncbi:MAG TPA: phosphate ABC transporter permease subunit PstC [Candidatus Limnocylindrales bacterium]|nr:phosphate ABC transporter permease subunit PstC [Candidatus Limnocylindrales bacterium]